MMYIRPDLQLAHSVFEAIKGLRRLRSFEFNAHTNLSPGSWSATHLLGLPPLKSISLILPDRSVADNLPGFLERQQQLSANDPSLALEDLTILCRESTVINDKVLIACTPYLEHTALRSLSLAGCAKLTGAPLLGLLPSLPALQHLSLEATAVQSSSFPEFAPHLASLLSLKLTHPGPHHPHLASFFPNLADLLRSTKRLEAFTLYHSGTAGTGTREWPVVDDSFVQELVTSVGTGLRKVEVSNVLMRVASVEALARGAPGLRDLVVHLGPELNSVRSSSSAAAAPTADPCISLAGFARATRARLLLPDVAQNLAHSFTSGRNYHARRARPSHRVSFSLGARLPPPPPLTQHPLPSTQTGHHPPSDKLDSAIASGTFNASTPRAPTHTSRSVWSGGTARFGRKRCSWCARKGPRWGWAECIPR